MLKSSLGRFSVILFAVLVVSLAASADGDSEVYVVSSSLIADAHYMSSNGDGSFSEQEILHLGSNANIRVAINYSFANGLGDFDGDGDQDYIMATGFFSGNIYISEKIEVGNQFAEPNFAGTWGAVEGQFANDFAVADFNKDGYDDFVLSLGDTSSSGLYINTTPIDPETGRTILDPETGNVIFEFSSELLPNTAVLESTGADAADFDGDGNADFVMVPYSAGEIFVSLGDGDADRDGTPIFTTTSFNTCDSCGGGWGVAAADFTGDGIADIAVATLNSLDLYVGAGDGINFTYQGYNDNSIVVMPPNSSAIDNYDFDGNGTQDLVVASQAGVVVMEGLGNGTFLYDEDDIYLGGTPDERNAVSAPPWVLQPVENMEPVAVIEPAYLEATAGEKIVLDGSNSFDEDGQIVSWEWDFGDAVPSADAPQPALMVMSLASDGPDATGVAPSYTYQQSGSYLVTLWVTDDKGSTSSVEAQVEVLAAKPKPLIPVKAKFSTLKLFHHSWTGKSRARGWNARYLWAKIEFPRGYDARKVDPASIYINPPDAPAIFARTTKKSGLIYKLYKKFSKPRKSIFVRFDRQAVLAALGHSPAKNTETIVGGKIFYDNEWQDFEGSGQIRVKMKKKNYRRAR